MFPMRSVLTSGSFYRFASSCFFTSIALAAAILSVLRSCFAGYSLLFSALVEVAGSRLLLLHLACANFLTVWFLPMTGTHTEGIISSEMTGKPCFARLTNFKQAQAGTKLGHGGVDLIGTFSCQLMMLDLFFPWHGEIYVLISENFSTYCTCQHGG